MDDGMLTVYDSLNDDHRGCYTRTRRNSDFPAAGVLIHERKGGPMVPVEIALEDVRLFDESAPDASDLRDRLHREVLEVSFPPEEYVGPSEDDADAPLLVAVGPDGEVLGGAVGERFRKSETLLLSYLAVRPGLRARGVGGRLMEGIVARWLDPETFAVLEIDDPRRHEYHKAHGDPGRRVRFYASFGVNALAMPYFQPRLDEKLDRAYNMLLGVLTVPDALRVGGGVIGESVAMFLEEYFEVCEGRALSGDEDGRWLLEWARRPSIALVPLAGDWRTVVPDVLPPSRADAVR
jgi:GNAT superfamily N-acetyltransferase